MRRGEPGIGVLYALDAQIAKCAGDAQHYPQCGAPRHHRSGLRLRRFFAEAEMGLAAL